MNIRIILGVIILFCMLTGFVQAGNSAIEWNCEGTSLHQLGKYEEAIDCYDKALAIDPDYAYAWCNKGQALRVLQRYEEAIECYNMAINLIPDYVVAWFNKGYSLNELGRYEEAIECYNKAIEFQPDFANSWGNKGHILLELDRYDEAIYCYDQALAIDPEHRSSWSNKGYALYELGRYEEAIYCSDKALAIDPNFKNSWNTKGYALYELGRYEEAIYCFDKALAIDHDFKNSWRGKGCALCKLGRTDEALECIDKALSIDPNYENALKDRENLLNGQCCSTCSSELSAQILDFTYPWGSYIVGSELPVTFTLKNTGDETHTFYSGYTLTRGSYEVINSQVKSIELKSGESKQVTLSGVPNEGMDNKYFNMKISVWSEKKDGDPVNEIASVDTSDSYPIFVYIGPVTVPNWHLYPDEEVDVIVDGTTYTAIPATLEGQDEYLHSWLILDENNQPVADLRIYKEAGEVAEVSSWINSDTETTLRNFQDGMNKFVYAEFGVQAALKTRDIGSKLLGKYIRTAVTGGTSLAVDLPWKDAAKVAAKEIGKEYAKAIKKDVEKLREDMTDSEITDEEIQKLLWAITIADLKNDASKLEKAADIVSQHNQNKPWSDIEITGNDGYYENYKYGIIYGMRDMELLLCQHPDLDFKSQMKDITKNVIEGASSGLFSFEDELSNDAAVVAAAEEKAKYEAVFSDLEKQFGSNAELIQKDVVSSPYNSPGGPSSGGSIDLVETGGAIMNFLGDVSNALGGFVEMGSKFFSSS